MSASVVVPSLSDSRRLDEGEPDVGIRMRHEACELRSCLRHTHPPDQAHGSRGHDRIHVLQKGEDRLWVLLGDTVYGTAECVLQTGNFLLLGRSEKHRQGTDSEELQNPAQYIDRNIDGPILKSPHQLLERLRGRDIVEEVITLR